MDPRGTVPSIDGPDSNGTRAPRVIRKGRFTIRREEGFVAIGVNASWLARLFGFVWSLRIDSSTISASISTRELPREIAWRGRGPPR